jgi:hypothetical protein
MKIIITETQLHIIKEDYKISAPRLKSINKISKDINKNSGISGSSKKNSPKTPSIYKKDDDVTKERKKKIHSLSKEFENITRTIKSHKNEIESLKSITNKTYDEYVDGVILSRVKLGNVYKNREDAIKILNRIGKLIPRKERKELNNHYIDNINDMESEINKLTLRKKEIWDELESLDK